RRAARVCGARDSLMDPISTAPSRDGAVDQDGARGASPSRPGPRMPTGERDDKGTHMQFGMIGLGRMGAGMARRLMRGGHKCVVYDRSPEAVSVLVKDGAAGAASLSEFVKKLDKPRALCLMVPAAYVDASIEELAALLEKDDTIIDGGNSHYHDDIARAKRLGAKGLHYVDMGTSGGVWGLERGYCLMIGGEAEVV